MPNLYRQDTTPGSPSQMAPPEGWSGDGKQYCEMMRFRYHTDLYVKQAIECIAFRMRSQFKAHISFDGPYASEAKEIVQAINKLESATRQKKHALAV